MTDIEQAELFPSSSVVGAAAGTIVYAPGGVYGPRIQRDIQLVLVHTGKADVTINKKLYTIPAGQVALLKPGNEEDFRFDSNQETWHRWIAVNMDGLSLETRSFLSSLPFHIPISEQMNQLTDMICRLMDTNSTDSNLLRLLGAAAVHLFISDSEHIERNRLTHTAVLKAKSFIREKYMEELTLKSLAHYSNVTAEHLIRLFHQYENTTPIKYLWQYRVQQSVLLLAHTGLSIGEIAGRTGFKNSFHCTRMIKLATGSTPTQLRKESWRGQ
jgi:AraC-like DNA-binding protein